MWLSSVLFLPARCRFLSWWECNRYYNSWTDELYSSSCSLSLRAGPWREISHQVDWTVLCSTIRAIIPPRGTSGEIYRVAWNFFDICDICGDFSQSTKNVSRKNLFPAKFSAKITPLMQLWDSITIIKAKLRCYLKRSAIVHMWTNFLTENRKN